MYAPSHDIQYDKATSLYDQTGMSCRSSAANAFMPGREAVERGEVDDDGCRAEGKVDSKTESSGYYKPVTSCCGRGRARHVPPSICSGRKQAEPSVTKGQHRRMRTKRNERGGWPNATSGAGRRLYSPSSTDTPNARSGRSLEQP